MNVIPKMKIYTIIPADKSWDVYIMPVTRNIISQYNLVIVIIVIEKKYFIFNDLIFFKFML